MSRHQQSVEKPRMTVRDGRHSVVVPPEWAEGVRVHLRAHGIESWPRPEPDGMVRLEFGHEVDPQTVQTVLNEWEV